MLEISSLPIQSFKPKADKGPGPAFSEREDSVRDFSADVDNTNDRTKSKDDNSANDFQNVLNQKFARKPEKMKVSDKKEEVKAEREVKDNVDQMLVPLASVPAAVPEVVSTVSRDSADAMSDFLVQVQEKANVTPEQWLEAMLKLEPKDLVQAPEQTAEKIVQQLNVPDSKKKDVLDLYSSLLSKMDVVEDQKVVFPELTADVEQSLGSLVKLDNVDEKSEDEVPKELPAQNTNFVVPQQNVEQKPQSYNLNSKQEKPQAAKATKLEKLRPEPKTETANVLKPTQEPMISENAVPVDALPADLMSMDTEKVVETKLAKSPVVTKAKEAKVDSKVLNMMDVVDDPQAESQSIDLTKINVAEESVDLKPFVPEKAANDKPALTVNSSATPDKTLAVNANVLNHSGNKNLGDTKKETKESKVNETETSSTGKSSDFFIDNIAQRDGSEKLSLTVNKPSAALGSAATANSLGLDGDVNTQEVIRHAQLMIRRGGGEISFKLNPDELGEINMKMIVDGDKVHLSMDTESTDAKKIVEGGLDDLRSTLSAHKLSLDTFKVDVSSKSDNQLTNHHHGDAERNANRENARQFMENFRDENMSQRQQIEADGPMRRTVMSHMRSEKPTGRASYFSNRSQSGRLNLVA